MSNYGHNSGNVASLEERKAYYIEEISRFVKEARKKQSLHYTEIAQADSLGRLLMQRQSILNNMKQYYAMVPSADVGPGVLAMVTMLSDNSQGYCSVSVGRMAEFLSRSRRAVGQAVQRLIDEGCIQREETDGGTHKLWPIVHSMFVNNKDPLTWALDAHSATVEAAKAASQVQSRVALDGAKAASLRRTTDAKAASQVVKFPTKSRDEEGGAKAASHVGDAKAASQGDLRVVSEGAKAASHNTTITNTTLRDSPLTPEIAERGVWGERASATDGEPGAQKAKRPVVELVLEPIPDDAVKVPTPRKGRGATGAQADAVDGGAAATSDRKKPARRFPTDVDERKRLGIYCREYAISHGMDEATFRLEVKQWADRAESRDERYVSWEAAWRTWVGNWQKWRREKTRSGFAPSRSQTIDDAMDIALGKMKDGK